MGICRNNLAQEELGRLCTDLWCNFLHTCTQSFSNPRSSGIEDESERRLESGINKWIIAEFLNLLDLLINYLPSTAHEAKVAQQAIENRILADHIFKGYDFRLEFFNFYIEASDELFRVLCVHVGFMLNLKVNQI